MADWHQLRELLNRKYIEYNVPEFVSHDPVSVPHRFARKQDIEIAGFFAAIMAWGQRVTIINKCTELLGMMDNAPHAFILQHKETDLKRFLHFRHRTFQPADVLYFIEFFKRYYSGNVSLEDAFARFLKPGDANVEPALTGFRNFFFSLDDYPQRTTKHIASPARNSSCKRLNMFLRWMVRQDGKGVDFGIWQRIKPAQLMCPLDVHVERVARKLGLLSRKQSDWKAVVELTANLKKLDPADPVKYDFALFGMGIIEKF